MKSTQDIILHNKRRMPGVTNLLTRNINAIDGRSTMRFEPEIWDGLAEICRREHMSMNDLVKLVEAWRMPGGRTSAMRVFALSYFRAAASEAGHLAVGHGLAAAAHGSR